MSANLDCRQFDANWTSHLTAEFFQKSISWISWISWSSRTLGVSNVKVLLCTVISIYYEMRYIILNTIICVHMALVY